MLGWLRIAGIVVGAASLLRLALVTGAVRYNDVFQAWMDRLRDIVELGFLLDVLRVQVALPLLEWLRSIGFDVPPLQSHWQSVFVLMWLPLAAIIRNTYVDAQATVLPIFLASIYTFAVAIGVGVLPAASSLVGWVPVGALVAFLMVPLLSFVVGGGHRLMFLRKVIPPLVPVCIAVLLVMVMAENAAGPTAVLALAVFALSVLAVLASVGVPTRRARVYGVPDHVSRVPYAVGVDVLATICLAFGVAVLAADPPLF